MAKKGLRAFCVCVLLIVSIIGIVQGEIHILYDNGTIADTERTLESHEDLVLICRGDEPLKWITPIVNESLLGTTITQSVIPDDKKHTIRLDIKNIAFKYVGFYTCQGNTGQYSSIYLYVHDEDHVAVNEEPFESITGELNMDVIFPCRPTTPNLTVEIYVVSPGDVAASYDPKIGFTKHISSLDDNNNYMCVYNYEFTQYYQLNVEVPHSILSPPEIIEVNEAHNEIGKTLTLLCTSSHPDVSFTWITPTGSIDKKRMSETEVMGNKTTSRLVISPTIQSDNGTYTCKISNKRGVSDSFSTDIKLYRKNEHFLYIAEENNYTVLTVNASDSKKVNWNILVRGHPHPSVQWFNNLNETITSKSGKYISTVSPKYANLEINDVSISDFGKYTIKATNTFETKHLQLLLNVTDKPKVSIHVREFNLLNSDTIIRGVITSNPPPIIYWEFKYCETCQYENVNETSREIVQDIKYVSLVKIKSNEDGFVRCTATNPFGTAIAEAKFHVTDVLNGFDIFDFEENMNYFNDEAEAAIGETVSMTCGCSSSNPVWYLNDKIIKSDDRITIQQSTTSYSKKSKLTVTDATMEHKGIYKCKIGNGSKYKQIKLNIKSPIVPQFKSNKDENINIIIPQPITLTCNVYGLPRPAITWYKDSKIFNPPDDRITIDETGRNITFVSTDMNDEGSYKCVASNKLGSNSKAISITIKNKPGSNIILYIIIAVIILILLVMSIFLVIHMRREKKLQRELKLAGLANFEKGATEQINPDLGVDEQADLLPYDKKWEFPFENLKLGKQLGAGAFGVVMRAEAKHILANEEVTTVAVKMVKKNADHMYIKALASELKIMVHLGQHLNVVNLLGAVTTNVAKKELMVIVEYCRYGNLQNYLLRHRNNFINQLDPNTGLIDYTIGQDLSDRSFSFCSYRDSTNSSSPQNSKGDYRGNESAYGDNQQTGATEMTNISVNSSGYVDRRFSRLNSENQPQWRSNYKGDYKDHGPPVCTKSLIVWSFQIARGMEYLASRKVLHGDLAARNVLLAENNIVKICDFGLAKSMYKNENYKKKSDGPLPIKWMAIESIRDKIFSTQSDVWSFGITMWEIFSLSRTPYPGMEADERLYYKLLNGYRMESPQYAPAEIYKIMLSCWGARAIDRPNFTELSEHLGKFLEDTTKEHYISLNEPYMQMNDTRLEPGQSDYLAMMNSPDFVNLSSPSYLNQLEGPDGYLTPTKIFSPRIEENTVFDFTNPKNISAEASRIELQPMLHTLNESDSDTPLQSPNSIANPSYHVPPQIDSQNHSPNYLNMSRENNLNDLNSRSNENIEERHYVNNGILV